MIYCVDKKSKSWSGEAIGILMLNCEYPFIPGNVGNANTYPFPVRYYEVKGSSTDRMLNQQDKGMLDAFIEGAQQLEREGVRAITGACGYMGLFQKEVADSVDIPVFLSSLLQAPFIIRTLRKGQKLGIISSKASVMTEEHFINAGITPDMPVALYGMEGKDEFRTSIHDAKGTLDSDLIEKEILEVCDDMLKNEGEIGAILLECSDLPPFAKAIHDHTGLPVFDYNTMINFVYMAVTPHVYKGHI